MSDKNQYLWFNCAKKGRTFGLVKSFLQKKKCSELNISGTSVTKEGDWR